MWSSVPFIQNCEGQIHRVPDEVKLDDAMQSESPYSAQVWGVPPQPAEECVLVRTSVGGTVRNQT